MLLRLQNFLLFLLGGPVSLVDCALPSCSSIFVPEWPKVGDPSEVFANRIFEACSKKMDVYANNPTRNRIEQKDLIGLVAFLAETASNETLQIFFCGIPNEYHSGSQFEPIPSKNLGIIERAFIFKSVIKDYEQGFLLGPFPPYTQFIRWLNPATGFFEVQPLRFVNVFTVPKTKRKQRVGRAVFDCKISGYNLGIPDEDAYVRLPRFFEVIALLRGKAFACVIDLKNAYRQWATTRASYCDFAYFIGGWVWIDTSLVFGVRSGVRTFQIISTALLNAIAKGNYSLFIINGNTWIIVYIDDLIMAALDFVHCRRQIRAVCDTLDKFNIPHDGVDSVPLERFVYLGIEYDLKLQACRVPSEKVHAILDLLRKLRFASCQTLVTKKEIESLKGKLIYFNRVNLFIRPLIDPIISLDKRLPIKRKFGSGKRFSLGSFKDLLPSLRISARLLLPLVDKND